MREDYSEELCRMFPKGFVIVYEQIDNTMCCCSFNPNKLECIKYYETITRNNVEN